MRNGTDLQRQRKKSAFCGVLLFSLFQIAFGAVFLALCFISGLPRWTVVLFGTLAAFCFLMVLPAFVVLRQRFQEIQGGELDEARQY